MNESEDDNELKRISADLDRLEARVKAEMPIEESLTILLTELGVNNNTERRKQKTNESSRPN